MFRKEGFTCILCKEESNKKKLRSGKGTCVKSLKRNTGKDLQREDLGSE